MASVRPFLWYNNQADEAAAHYEEIFAGSTEVTVDRAGGSPAITIGGTELYLFDGGPVHFSFNESMSLFVSCADQEEVDRYWFGFLEAGGEASQCGWLKDRYGLSWQIVPEALGRLLGDPNPARSQAALQAMLKMQRLIVADLEAAADAAG